MAQGYINDRTTDYLSLKSRLLTGASGQLSDQFDALNLHLRQASLVTPGQMVIVPDAYAVACTTDDAWLMRHAQEIQRNLELDASAGAAVINNYDLFQSLLAYSSVESAVRRRPGGDTWTRFSALWKKLSVCINNSRMEP